MPNHVTTICTVTGPGAHTFRAAHIRRTDDGKGDFFDFETIIPVPACLEGTVNGTRADHGFYALTGLIEPGRFIPRDVESYRPHGYKGPMVPASAVAEWLAANQPETLDAGRRSLAAFKETGHRDWYTWNIEHWGTKWGAYDCEIREVADDRVCFKFETAWSFPDPIFRKLAEMYPRLVFEVASYDEGGYFGCRGSFNGANDYRMIEPPPPGLYREVYGHDKARDDE